MIWINGEKYDEMSAMSVGKRMGVYPVICRGLRGSAAVETCRTEAGAIQLAQQIRLLKTGTRLGYTSAGHLGIDGARSFLSRIEPAAESEAAK